MSAYAVAAGFTVAGTVWFCLTLLRIARRLDEIERKLRRVAGEEDAANG